ncbi:MAG: secretion system protein [Thermoproteus sp. AZ2]|uniref:Secretion system protein n=1 Tax=Thermoproteus sp. AZ2 TaxID=1609232 RepID=A0ACC6UZX1_9CREN
MVLVLTAAGGYLIRDLVPLAVFVALSAAAAFLLSFLLNAPSAVLGLAGLATAVVKLIRRRDLAAKLAVPVRRTYRSRRRLDALEERTKTLSHIRIVDVVPAGSSRSIHPKLLEILDIVERAEALGYSAAIPRWLAELSQYRRLLGSQYMAREDVVVGETDIIALE